MEDIKDGKEEVLDWCFIFVFHEEHRKYHEYPEY